MHIAQRTAGSAEPAGNPNNLLGIPGKIPAGIADYIRHFDHIAAEAGTRSTAAGGSAADIAAFAAGIVATVVDTVIGTTALPAAACRPSPSAFFAITLAICGGL